MPELHQFTGGTLPDHFGWQIRDFVRIHWFDIFAYDLDAAVHPAEWHPAYFVIADQRVLFSNATAVWQDVAVDGETYRAYGLSSVMTYPAFRNKGYGLRVVTAATDYIRQQPDADMAILWTTEEMASFYHKTGWSHPEHITLTSGDPTNPTPTHFFMLMFLSEKGRQLQASLAGRSLYFGPYTW